MGIPKYGYTQAWGYPSMGIPKYGYTQVWVYPSMGLPKYGYTQAWGYPSMGIPKLGVTQVWVYPSLGLPKYGYTQAWGYPSMGIPKYGYTQAQVAVAAQPCRELFFQKKHVPFQKTRILPFLVKNIKKTINKNRIFPMGCMGIPKYGYTQVWVYLCVAYPMCSLSFVWCRVL